MTHARTVALISLSCLLALAAGCASSTLKGRVIKAEIGRVVVVGATDDRMETEGIADAEVTISQGGVLAKGTTNSSGEFTFSVRDDRMRSGPILVLVEGDGFFRVQNQVQIPNAGQAILVNVVERNPSGDRP